MTRAQDWARINQRLIDEGWRPLEEHTWQSGPLKLRFTDLGSNLELRITPVDPDLKCGFTRHVQRATSYGVVDEVLMLAGAGAREVIGMIEELAK